MTTKYLYIPVNGQAKECEVKKLKQQMRERSMCSGPHNEYKFLQYSAVFDTAIQ